MHDRIWKTLSRILTLVILASLPAALFAQAAGPSAATAKSTKTTMSNNPDSPSQWDIFAGYSALIPNGVIPPTGPKGFAYNSINYGAIMSITRDKTLKVGTVVLLHRSGTYGTAWIVESQREIRLDDQID